MAAPRASARGPRDPLRARAAHLPTPRTSWIVLVLSVGVIVVSGWLAGRPGAHEAQTALVVWFNHPPQPLGALFALVNPLFRPVPLIVLAVVLAGWVLIPATAGRRLECLRALAGALFVAELLAQTLKRVVDQPRPTAVIPGLDVHGYPQDPWGRAYPSAHTALTVAAVAALWPWMSRAPAGRRPRSRRARATQPDLHRRPLAPGHRRRGGRRAARGGPDLARRGSVAARAPGPAALTLPA